jgi:hypothetical protein
LSNIRGLESIFSGEPENETTAEFTFVTNATTDRVIVNGPFKIVNRSGTTTIYRNTEPADFNNPETFSQGTPIQNSTYRQQVVLNTLTDSFVTVHTNVITRTQTFSLNGNTYRLGWHGAAFRTSYFGQSNTEAVPSGWFGDTPIVKQNLRFENWGHYSSRTLTESAIFCELRVWGALICADCVLRLTLMPGAEL